MAPAALSGALLSAISGPMLAAVVALLVAVCVVLPSAPPLRHRLLRAALLRASGWQRRRLELQSTDVRHGQERRLRRLLPPGEAPGSEAFRERHPPSTSCNDGERAEPLPPLSLWAVLRSCWRAEPALQGVLLYLHALHRTFPQALTLRGTALLGWAPTAPRTPGFCPLPTLYCTPPEAAALPLRSAALRVQLLFALQTRALRVLEARLPNELHDVLAALRDGWAELAHDLALGTLSPQPGLPEEVRGRLQALLVPDGTRAAELRAECERGFEGIVRRLWPQLQVVVVGTVRGGERLYYDALSRAACEGLPLYCPWYRVAGALLGVNLWPKEPTPRFVLCPEWAFCEFLPCPAEEEEKQHTVLLGELWEGREYTLILTARPREYRCRAGEVLQVAGFHKQCPVVEPVRRESQALSVRGESIPEEQFCRSLCRAVGMWPGARLMDYICVESTLLGAFSGASAPHYEVFVELRGLRDLSEGQRHKLDHCLQEDFPIYKSFRFKGSIGPLRLHLVGAGAFARLREAMGRPVPMPRVLREERLLAVIQGTVIS
ncbi:LOW QUALITY PROTEIN: GH3 domain-containing protein [Lagopus muta]|uniref:LOW QUALITY PROTEIN: GH3 domain-containing protein n=1 Tax=Lagopus muta TaxID=64668 RepID=UPI0020A204E3|nr:LOW QUALITY PROTEIN: GH3 domain-containing protein [Lagopus muta]